MPIPPTRSKFDLSSVLTSIRIIELRNAIHHQDLQLNRMHNEKQTLLKIKKSQEDHLKKVATERENFLKVGFEFDLK